MNTKNEPQTFGGASNLTQRFVSLPTGSRRGIKKYIWGTFSRSLGSPKRARSLGTSLASLENKTGFTLIELLVVISIIGLISSIVLVSMKGFREDAKIARSKKFSSSIQHVLGSDAVGIWRFEEGEGIDIHDESGYSNDGTFYGNPTPVFSDGVYPGTTALLFDGVNDYVQVTDPVSLRVQTHTVEFWIQFNSIAAGAWRPVLRKYGAGSDRAPGIWRHTTYPLRLHWRYNPGNLGFGGIGPRGEGTDFDLNKWYHVVGVKDGTALGFYVNGNFVASVTVPNPITQGAGNFILGGSANAPAVILDEVRIYEQALTIGEIQKHYAEGARAHGIALQ